MTDLDILDELIDDQSRLKTTTRASRKHDILLQETSGDKNYGLKVTNIRGRCLAFKADKFPSLSGFFKCKTGECKRADFVLIVQNSKNWIVCIEMKYGNPGEATTVQQLRGAACLVDYCRAIGSSFWGKPDFLDRRKYELRFVSIKNIGINKKPTATSPESGIHDKPENPLKLLSPPRQIQFRQLISANQ